MTQTNEAAFETVIEAHLLANGYVAVDRNGFDRERAIFSETVLAFMRATQANEWISRDAPHAAAERTIALLKERRTALIATAVTGRITIRESTEDTLPGADMSDGSQQPWRVDAARFRGKMRR
jgi:ABC-type nitrate/sulfonate/bicarbonate transport system substrate-binding protein